VERSRQRNLTKTTPLIWIKQARKRLGNRKWKHLPLLDLYFVVTQTDFAFWFVIYLSRQTCLFQLAVCVLLYTASQFMELSVT
jgi:hypothetical protein